jgi:hypothetical protein
LFFYVYSRFAQRTGHENIVRLAFSTVLLGFLAACATGEEPGAMLGDGSSGSANDAGSFNSAGTNATSGSGGSSAGSFSSGGGGSGGASSGGTFTNGGFLGTSGTSFSGGTGGSAAGGAAAGGSGGAALGGAGGKPSAGGSGGKATGGGGTGGTPATGCPAKSMWTATASVYADTCPTPDDTGDYCGPPERAIDGVTTNRFSTGEARKGTEWLQIDFTKSVSVSGLTLTTPNGDYTLAYEVRMSNNEADIAASTPVVTGTGQQGTTTITFPAAKAGRYLRINQTMAMAGWWSVYEMNVQCQ